MRATMWSYNPMPMEAVEFIHPIAIALILFAIGALIVWFLYKDRGSK